MPTITVAMHLHMQWPNMQLTTRLLTLSLTHSLTLTQPNSQPKHMHESMCMVNSCHVHTHGSQVSVLFTYAVEVGSLHTLRLES